MSTPTPSTKPHILVVIENHIIGMALGHVLSINGYEVSLHQHPQDAISFMAQHSTDLILLDTDIPDVKGCQACECLRTLSQQPNIPIIVLVNADNTQVIDDAFGAGATDFITKPIHWPLLSRRIQFALRAVSTASQLTRLTLHDKLTDLPNRDFFIEVMNQWTHKLTDPNKATQFAVLAFDVDRFKYVNQSLGTQAGDVLLQAIAHRLRTIAREGDVIARLGSDEFIILVEIHTKDAIDVIAARYFRSLIDAYDITGEQRFITISLGIALAPADSQEAETLLTCANTAKTRAKKAGGNQLQFYTADMNAQASKRFQLENDLRQAIALGQLQLRFQPKINAENYQLAGAEALVTWQHPRLGLLSPDDFIPIAEETGMIVAIGDWILQQACLQCAIWQKQVAHFHMGINLSSRQFLQHNLPTQVAIALQNSQLNAKQLDLEITESLAMIDVQHTTAILNQLKALGVNLSIDDFGTGYSSLAYLQRFPVDSIKIDRSFVMSIGTDTATTADEKIVTSIIAMANSLQLNVVAEGVETRYQADFLRQQGCNTLQGYYFGRPMTVNDFESAYPELYNGNI
jgi:diguanylate cyclase (GGDEF)-like protein